MPTTHCTECGTATMAPDDAPRLCTYCATTRYAAQLAGQGEAVRLFTPAPAQMPGQMMLDRTRTMRGRAEIRAEVEAERRAGQFSCAACGTDEAMPGHAC
jgi:hypothetical protein